MEKNEIVEYNSSENEEQRVDDVGAIDAEAERKLVRKLDYFIVPVVMLLYLFSFLDRVNIGNARLYGLEEDLGLQKNQYQTAVSILFVTYVLSELPSNLIIKKLRPSRYIAGLTTIWGIIATLTGVAQSYGGLIAARLFLGLVEGGLFPGMVVYLTLFYTKRELALRIGYLFVSSAIAGMCGGLLAFAIGHMDGVAGQSGWRWILIIEGLPTFVLGIVCWFYMADNPETAWYLTQEERLLVKKRKQRQQGYTTSSDEFHWVDVRKGLLDWKCWAFYFAQTGVDTVLYGYSTFLPTIIQAIGPQYTKETVQVLTIPCYALGAITYLTCAYFSDRTQKRAPYPIALGLVCVVGYAILLSDVRSGVHYFGCFLVAMGLYVSVGIPLAWLPSNLPRYGKRSTAIGMQLTMGNIAGAYTPFLYATDDKPRYITGHATTLALSAFSSLIFTFMWWYLSRQNKLRSEQQEALRQQGHQDGMTEEEAELGDESVWFHYTT